MAHQHSAMKPDSALALMIDIETLGLGMDAFVTQVGICLADTTTRKYLIEPVNFWLERTGQETRPIDFDTVRWWLKQDPKVAASVFEGAGDSERVTPAHLYERLRGIWAAHECTVWASPAGFDLSILTSLFGQRKPWKYNVERDMMTLYKLLDPQGKLQPPANDKAHDAAADAHWQMEYLFRLLDLLRIMEERLNPAPDLLTVPSDPRRA